MSVCRYDATGALEQSELLDGNEMGAAIAALEAAPEFVGSTASRRRARRSRSSGCAPLSRGRRRPRRPCPLVHGPDPDRALTADVVYWALSPGWTGALDQNIPLPPELRGQ